MPTYLCHGFRWTRRLVRIFVILENLDDAAPDWIVGRRSSKAILGCFSTKFDFLPQRTAEQISAQRLIQQNPVSSLHQDDNLTVPPSRVPDSRDAVLWNDWSPVKLLEEYDTEETAISARPFAYVADYAIRIDLSANITEELAKYEALVKARNEGDWLEKLRDELQKDAPIEWYVVVNGDEERAVPGYSDEITDDDYSGEVEPTNIRPNTAGSPQVRSKNHQQNTSPSTERQPSLRHKMSRAGLRRLFGKKEAPE